MGNRSLAQKIYLHLRNPVSIAGILLAVVCTALGLPMMFIDIFIGGTNPYAGILTYMVFPLVSAVGVAIAVAGAIWKSKKRVASEQEEKFVFPRIDFNNPKHRTVAGIVIFSTVVAMALIAVTSYRAYHFSDSTQFCGQACHEVMKPEYTAYQHSPHARVGCVECHIGQGAGWFVKAKITGAYQVYSVMFDKFSRPIETPLKNLRPAQDTCEQCHWPAKFFGAQQKTFTHFLSDENNSPWQIQTLLKIGGGDPKTGAASGIHYHMNIANEIYYKDPSGKKDVIPWVRVVKKDGKTTEYKSSESNLSDEELAKLPARKMDCLDCHNRPSHVFHPPATALDQIFAAGILDPNLPYLKREATRILSEKYSTEKEARDAIEKELVAFYRADYPDVFKEKFGAITNAVKAVQDLFSRTIFPEMKADWRAYPNHLGHWTSDGCFRCHDGLHQNAEGKTITNDCNACHTILAQGTPSEVAKARLETQVFRHPVEIGVDVTQMKCTSCHSGSGN